MALPLMADERPSTGRRAAFFQFPLCLLQLPPQLPRHSKDKEFAERILANYIIAWSLVDAGAKQRKKEEQRWSEAEVKRMLSERAKEIEGSQAQEGNLGRLPSDFDPSEYRHLDVLAANEWLFGLKHLPKVEVIAARHRHVRNHKRAYLGMVGEGDDRFVRMRKDLVATLLHKKIMSRREFCVLAGFYAGIGSSWYSRISLKYAGLLAAGYKSADAWKKVAPLRRKLGTNEDPYHEPLAEHQVSYTRDKLLDSKWLFKYFDGRHCYYSHRKDNEELADAVQKRKFKGDTRRESRKKREARAKQKAEAKHKYAQVVISKVSSSRQEALAREITELTEEDVAAAQSKLDDLPLTLDQKLDNDDAQRWAGRFEGCGATVHVAKRGRDPSFFTADSPLRIDAFSSS